MTGFLLDTNVPSELIRLHPEPKVAGRLASQTLAGLFISAVSFGELRKGIILRAPGKRRAELEYWLENDLSTLFSGRILPAQVFVGDALGVGAFGEDAAVAIGKGGFAKAGGFEFGGLLDFVEALKEKEVGDLLDNFDGVSDAAGPEGVPDVVDLIADFAGEHVGFSYCAMSYQLPAAGCRLPAKKFGSLRDF